jgi:hypothetical protein
MSRLASPSPISTHPCDHLLADVFALLYIANQGQLKMHGGFLSPKAITTLRLLMSTGVAQAQCGRPRPHIVHFLCRWAGLVAAHPTLQGVRLLPTQAGLRWVSLPASQQRQQVQQALLQAAPLPLAQLWRALKMPGWRLLSANYSLHPLLRLAQTPQPRLALSGLVKQMAGAAEIISTHPDAQPRTLVLAWLGLLSELSLAVPGPRNSWRIAPAEASDDSAKHLSLMGRPIRAQVQCQVQGIPNKYKPGPITLTTSDLPNLSALFDLNPFAALTHGPFPFTFTLQPTLIQISASHGASLAGLRRWLTAHIPQPLPPPLVAQINHWQRSLKLIQLSRPLLLEVPDADLLTQLTQQHGIRVCIQRTLSARAVVIRESQAHTLLRRLQWRGHWPSLQADVASTANASTFPSTEPTATSTAHLYVSARLGHELADVLPVSYRLPHALMAQLRQQLTAQQLSWADQTVQAALDAMRHRAPPPLEPLDPDDPASSWPLDENDNTTRWLPVVQAAIAGQQPLHLHYTDASGEPSTRTIDPLRIEHRGLAAYLIAFCHLAQAQRSFRLSRIQSLGPVLSAPPAT